MEVTHEQLVEALQEFHLWVTPARTQSGGVLGTVQQPQAVADGLLLALRANAAHDDRDVVDAHIHCDHVLTSRADSELAAADQVVRLLEPLGYAGSRRLKRVLTWAWDYLTDGDEPPF
jgi:hypothetical protein